MRQKAPSVLGDTQAAPQAELKILTIHKPLADETIIVDALGYQKLLFNFAFKEATILFLNVDVVFNFSDGSKIILPNLAFHLVGVASPDLIFTDSEVTVPQLLASLSDLTLSQDGVSFQLNAQHDTKHIGEDASHQDLQFNFFPKVTLSAFTSLYSLSALQADQPAELGRVEYVKLAMLGDGGWSGEPWTLSGNATSYTPPSPTPAPPPSGSLATLDVGLFGFYSASSVAYGSGQIIKTSPFNLAAETDSSFAVQYAARNVSGTAFADIIYADNPDAVAAGSFVRKLDITIDMPQSGWVGQSVFISGLPAGFSVLNGTPSSGGYTITLNPISDPNHFTLQLQYNLPDNAATPDVNGFFSFFNLNLQITASTGSGTTTVSAIKAFGIRDVNSSADITYIHPVTGESISILAANPAGAAINAGNGDDKIYSGAGGDQINGSDGSDAVDYSQSQDAVTINLNLGAASGGYAEGDVLTSIENITGSFYDDTITGDAGDNIIDGGAGNDILVGGAGNDTLSYQLSNAGVTVNLLASLVSGGHAQGDTISSFENVLGSNYNDTLIGNASSNELSGVDGDDTLEGGGGADVLDGGNGIDTVTYASSASFVIVNLTTGTGLNGDAQGDTLINIEHIIGSSYGDTLVGDGANNSLDGGSGDDVLEGRGGADTLIGGSGSDTISYENSTSGVTINLASSSASGGDATGDTFSSIENIIGSNYADLLIGDDGNNTINGLLGDDILIGGLGADTLIGDSGSDTASYQNATSGLVVSLATPASNTGEALGDTYSGIENLTGSNYADTLTGDGGDNILTGGAGADQLDGGGGSNTASYYNALTAIVASLTSPASNTGDALGDTYTSIQNLTGSSFDDTLIGDAGANILTGGDGNDTLEGLDGADSYFGGNGQDSVSYAASNAAVTVNLNTNTASGGHATGDTFNSIEVITGSIYNDTITGSLSSETLNGGDGHDIIYATGGNDILNGGNGNDFLYSGTGADSFIGGAGVNYVVYNQASSGITLDFSNRANDLGEAVGDSFTQISGIFGSNYGDTITVTTGSPTIIVGLSGNDTFHANSSWSGTLIGGDGADSFHLSGSFGTIVSGSGADAISDTSIGQTIFSSTPYQTASYTNVYTFTAPSTFSSSLNFSGVTVNLETGGTRGDALGDTYSGIEAVSGSYGRDEIYGDNNQNFITLYDNFEGGSEIVDAKGGDDVIGTFLSFNAVIDGGAGSDWYYQFNWNNGGNRPRFEIDLDTGVANIYSHLGGGIWFTQTLTNIENIVGAAYDDILQGNASDNAFVGSTGNDQLIGRDGNDTLTGGAGADVLDGGTGSDWADYARISYRTDFISSSAVVVDLVTPASNTGDAAGDTFISIENIRGGSGNDTLHGDGNDNILDGNSGDDLLEGRGGADTLIGGSGTDTITYANASSAVVVDLASALGSMGEANGDSYSSIENIIGSAYNDSLRGNAVANVINAGDGDDFIIGGGGGDTLIGGNGSDTVSYERASGSVSVSLSSSITNTGDAAGDSYSSIENISGSFFDDIISGNAQDNVLNGIAGNDLIIAGFGNDYLDGGAGDDEVYGEDGNDTFVSISGADFMSGGQGDDTFYINASSLSGAGTNPRTGGSGIYIDGEDVYNGNQFISDNDQVIFYGNSGSFTEAQFIAALHGINRVDVTAANIHATLNLTASEIASITGRTESADNRLWIEANAGDNITYTAPPGGSVVESSGFSGETIYTYFDSLSNQLAELSVHIV